MVKEFLMVTYYESGAKRAVMEKDHHIQMCQVIFYKENVEKGLLEVLESTDKKKVIACAANIVQSIILHGRNRESTTLQFLNGMVLLHGGCTHMDIEHLSKLGVCVLSETTRKKLQSLQSNLDDSLLSVKTKWSEGDNRTFQLVGDNWDKNIVPSYRNSQQTTQSIHLFSVIGVIDRVVIDKRANTDVKYVGNVSPSEFIPSVADITQLQDDLTFIVARSVIENNQQMNELLGSCYPDHLEPPYSNGAGKKTTQTEMQQNVYLYKIDGGLTIIGEMDNYLNMLN